MHFNESKVNVACHVSLKVANLFCTGGKKSLHFLFYLIMKTQQILCNGEQFKEFEFAAQSGLRKYAKHPLDPMNWIIL